MLSSIGKPWKPAAGSTSSRRTEDGLLGSCGFVRALFEQSFPPASFGETAVVDYDLLSCLTSLNTNLYKKLQKIPQSVQEGSIQA
jgi:hypothetical protein